MKEAKQLIEMYSEPISTFITKVHDAANSRYDLDGYDLHVIEAALIELQDFKSDINMKNEEVKNFPWVLYLRVEIRKDWFSKLWKTRGANYLEMQIWIFKITIGMPWIKHVLEGYLRDYKSLESAKKTNNSFLIMGKSVQIGNYKTV